MEAADADLVLSATAEQGGGKLQIRIFVSSFPRNKDVANLTMMMSWIPITQKQLFRNSVLDIDARVTNLKIGQNQTNTF